MNPSKDSIENTQASKHEMTGWSIDFETQQVSVNRT